MADSGMTIENELHGVGVDVGYCMGQLERAKSKQWTGQGCVDELTRAIDALERIQAALESLGVPCG